MLSPKYLAIFLLDDLPYPQLPFDIFEINKSLYIQSALYEPPLVHHYDKTNLKYMYMYMVQYCYNFNSCKIKLVHK